MKTLYLSYSKKRKLPSFPGDKSPPTYVQDIYVSNGASWEATTALDNLGFHVMHPIIHPNGSGGIPALVFHPIHKALPKQLEV